MYLSAAWKTVVLIPYLGCTLSAQTTSSAQTPQPQSIPAKPAQKQPVKPKLTPQQEQGLRLLKTAEDESAGLEASARTFVLWKVSLGYRKVDPHKADVILRRAFVASQSIDNQAPSDDCHIEQVCHIQTWLQREILMEMMGRWRDKSDPDPKMVEKLLPQANADVKKQMLEQLAEVYLGKHDFDRVRQLMSQMDEDRYSYYLAGQLIAALPTARRGERLAVFSEAYQHYRNQNQDDLEPNETDDFGVLVVRFWHGFPPSMVLDAADTVLDRANERDEIKHVRGVTMALTRGGSLPFATEYEFRLFQFLPILKELDSSKAEHLLDEHDSARHALDQYPSGMQSLDPNYYGDKPPDQTTIPAVMDVSSNFDDPAANSAYQLDLQIQGHMREIRAEIEKDPDQAYSDAMNLPLRYPTHAGCPRATALKWFALAMAEKNPTLAKTAMNETRRLAQDVEPARQALLLAEVPDFYFKLGDEDGARGAIKDQMKLAEKIYAIDTDPDDPNLAFKGAWPSANTWRNCIQEATKISSAFAEELLSQVGDPDIAGVERVMYANALIGAGKSSIAVVEWHKSGKKSDMFMSQ